MGARLIHFVTKSPARDEADQWRRVVNPPSRRGRTSTWHEDSIEPNLIGLRALLYANGYRSVNCQMHHGVLVLWGTVPHEIDRVVIQMFVLGNSRDGAHSTITLRVEEADADLDDYLRGLSFSRDHPEAVAAPE